MRQVAHYLQERLPQLAYADFRAAGYPIGSGAVESANKRVVEGRLKGGGMHWTVANANAVLALRGCLCSQRWDEGWEQIIRQRQRRVRGRASELAPVLPPQPPAKRSSLRTRIATVATPNPYFTDGKPNATHPYKQDFARKYGTTDRAAIHPDTKI